MASFPMVVAITFGNLAEWISAVAASALVVAAIVLLAHGRRTDIDVTAEARSLRSGLVLDVRLKVHPVGSFRVKPYAATHCDDCQNARHNPANAKNITSRTAWSTSARCAAEARGSNSKDLRLPTLRKNGAGMKRRRAMWGCPNRRIPYLEIREVRAKPANGPNGLPQVTEETIIWLMNPFRGQYAEPQETLQLTHLVPVATHDDSVIGWRVRLALNVPMETWYFQRPSDDSWDWEDDDFVPVPTTV
jgi:hypothetical protein